MDEIEVGEYVRTKDGVIAKVLSDDGFFLDIDKRYFNERYQNMRKFIIHEQITKHSPNIIDLIEVKDFIEVRIGDEVVSKFLIQDEHQLESTRIYVREGSMKILAVVTHEQFNSIKYEVYR